MKNLPGSEKPKIDEDGTIDVMRLKPRIGFSAPQQMRREKDYPQLPNANLSARQSGHCLRIFEMMGPCVCRLAGS